MKRPWKLLPGEITPQSVLLSRRTLLLGAAAGSVVAGAGLASWWLRPGSDQEVLGTGANLGRSGEQFYPAPTNPAFAQLDRPLTPEAEAARYCNFYEFSSFKSVWRHIHSFTPDPWQLEVTGLVAKPRTFDIDGLIKAFSPEERAYRHRCVEAWAMAVPWTGIPFKALAKAVEPLPEARFVRFVSFHRPQEASRQRDRSYPWPYTEGLSLAEAVNDLTFLATGMYGHPLLPQHGAPVRLIVPWKYGFKGAKSLVRIEFTSTAPATFWNTLSPQEYDFEANVNPRIPHPRWSQQQERMLGTGEVRPTQLYNGYAPWVAQLYQA